MAGPINPTQLTPPRVPLIDDRTGAISREWYRFFLSLLTATQANQDESNYQPDAASLLASYDAMLADLTQTTETAPNSETAVASLEAEVDTLEQTVLTAPRSELGTMAALQQANLPWFTLNTAPSPVPVDVGSVYWDGGTTMGVQMTPNVVGRVNEDLFYYIKASGAITKGQVIMFDGAVGASGVIKGKPATGVTNGSYIMGIAAESISLNSFGLVQYNGSLKGINTSAFSDGDILWYDPSVTGGLTKTEPSAPNVKVQVAAVTNAANNGSVVIRVTAGSTLGGTDSNVKFGTLSDKDIIQYDSALQYWKNVAPSSVSIGTATNLAGGAANQIPYQTAASTTSFISAPTIANTYLEWSGSAFQWSSNPVGTVTSVAMTVPTGLQVTGSPITTSGTLAISFASGYSIPTTISQANWDTAYTDRLKWDGGSTGLVASTGRTSLGATTVGSNLFTLTNPSAITFLRINADNSVSTLDAATFRTAIGAGTGSGTVTSVSVVTSNGFAGTVATSTTTPAITLSTTVTGLVKGNGTALSAAVAATDYVAPSAYASTNGLTMATSRLLGRTTASTGAAEEISVAGGLTLSGGVLTGASGTVTSVAALTLGTTGTDLSSSVANGTTTPVITLNVPTASATNRGALSSTDWSTFNGKQAALVSGTNIKTVGGVSLLGSGDVGIIGSAYGGTGNGFTKFSGPATSEKTFTLPNASATILTDNAAVTVAQGGTGQTSYTNGQLLIGNTTGNTLTKSTLTAGSGISITNGAGSITIAATGGSGTVTSVDVSGGTTGLTTTGGPITTSGTISLSGTLVAANGGTGQSSYTIGDILYASSTTALSKLADVATGNALISGGVGVAPSWGKIGLTTHVSGTLGVANGGTGATTFTAGYLLKGNTTSAISSSVVYDDGTNVGIGVVPSYKLDVSSGAANAMRVSGPANVYSDVTDGTGTFRVQLLSNTPYIGSSSNHALVLITNNSERGRFTNTGDFGIGTASPARKLDVNGSIRLGDAQVIEWGGTAYSITGDNGGAMIFRAASAERVRIHASGGVSINNTTDPGAGNLSVTGTITSTSASANALAAGLNGATNPAFNVDASTASSATGLNVKSAAAGGGVAVSAISSGANENLTIDAKGTGTVTINGTGTGAITLARNTNVTGNLSATGQLDGGYNDTTGTPNTAAQALGTNTVSMVLISANTTLTSTVPAAGAHASVIIKTSGTTTRTVTFGTGFKSQGTLATGGVDARYWVVNFVSDGTFLYETSRTTTAYA